MLFSVINIRRIIMSETELLLAISKTVANLLDADQAQNIKSALAKIIPGDYSSEQRKQILDEAQVYTIEANRPGYAAIDGKIGYLESGVNLKEAVLDELRTMREADFDASEHAEGWDQLIEEIKNTPDNEFTPGLTINCPDDYVLNIVQHSVAGVLNGIFESGS